MHAIERHQSPGSGDQHSNTDSMYCTTMAERASTTPPKATTIEATTTSFQQNGPQARVGFTPNTQPRTTCRPHNIPFHEPLLKAGLAGPSLTTILASLDNQGQTLSSNTCTRSIRKPCPLVSLPGSWKSHRHRGECRPKRFMVGFNKLLLRRFTLFWISTAMP